VSSAEGLFCSTTRFMFVLTARRYATCNIYMKMEGIRSGSGSVQGFGVCMCIYMCVCVCVYVYVCVCMYVCLYVCMWCWGKHECSYLISEIGRLARAAALPLQGRVHSTAQVECPRYHAQAYHAAVAAGAGAGARALLGVGGRGGRHHFIYRPLGGSEFHSEEWARVRSGARESLEWLLLLQ
jgi:hypothetical protein